MDKQSKLRIITNGIIKENPILVLLLGTCPFLATSTSAINGLGMGLSTTAVLICSNVVISLLKNVIPDRVRIPCYIVVIAGFVTVVQFLLQAYLPDLNKSLGLYIPLIVVNCIILGRAEMFANKNTVIDSALDGIGMGLGFTIALFFMGAIREFFGAGTVMGYEVTTNLITPMVIFILPAGGFFVYGILCAIINKMTGGSLNREFSCAGCPGEAACAACATGTENPAACAATKNLAEAAAKKAVPADKAATTPDKEVPAAQAASAEKATPAQKDAPAGQTVNTAAAKAEKTENTAAAEAGQTVNAAAAKAEKTANAAAVEAGQTANAAAEAESAGKPAQSAENENKQSEAANKTGKTENTADTAVKDEEAKGGEQ